MGFDLIGANAKSKKGEYFRNNVWWWRPLWHYLKEEKLITDEQYKSGGYNDGLEIDQDQAMKIGAKLKHLVSQGKTKQYEEEYKKMLNDAPDEQCDACKGTGQRNDKDKCNACDGKGKKRPWMCSYPFSVENVKEFAMFCIESGGFAIW